MNDTSGDGYMPMAGLTNDDRGNLYGTTEYGGSAGKGTVFRRVPWTEHGQTVWN